MTKTIIVAAVFALAVGFRNAEAMPAYSSDVWVAEMERQNLFQAHPDFCDNTEEFIAIGGGNRGFCIEKDDRTAEVFYAARETCLAAGKRLPEPVEWQYACHNGTSLVDLLDGYEWISNFPFLMQGSLTLGPVVSISGPSTDCDQSSTANASNHNSGTYPIPSFQFRCVR